MIQPWIYIALIAGLLSNTSNFFYRYLLKDENDAAVYAWFLEIIRLVGAVILIGFSFFISPGIKTYSLLIALGILEFVSMFIYMKQHAYTHLSVSTIISRTRLIWTALFAFILLGEHIKLISYIGISLLFIGLSVGTSPNKLFMDKGMKYAYLSAIFISVINIFMKSASLVASSPIIVGTMSLETVFIYPVVMKNPVNRIFSFLKKNLLLKICGATANVAAIFFLLWALSMGPVSIVNALYQGTMVFAILAGILILKEKEQIGKKIFGTAIALVGIMLLA